jgi:hypothetical protein
MQTITKEYKVFSYDELSDSAKENALQKYNEYLCVDMELDWEVDRFKEAGEMLGIDIDDVLYSISYSQGDGACFTGAYSYKKGAVKAVKKEYPEWTALHDIAQALQDIQRPYFYGLSASVSHTSRYYHELSPHICVERQPSIGCDYRVSDTAEDDIQQALRDFMCLIYQGLLTQYEYETGQECFEESCAANEYTFLENGDFFV